MHRGLLILLAAVFAAAALPATAQACDIVGSPYAVGSPGCQPGIAVVCPGGDAGAIGVDVINSCTGTALLCLRPVAGLCTSCVPCIPVLPAPGVVQTFFFRRAGGCGNAIVELQCLCPPFSVVMSIPIKSPDLSGDCHVNAVDFAIFGLAWLTVDFCTDFNCSGGVTGPPDFAIFAAHWLHFC